MPGTVRSEVEATLGARVVRGVRAWGGYAPSATFRLFLDDGRRVMYKGSNSESTDFMRRALVDEERVYRELGEQLQPWAPAYLGSVAGDGWHALLLEDVGPARIPPWTEHATRVAMRGYAAFHRAAAARKRAWPAWLTRARLAEFARIWHTLQAEPGGLEAVARLARDRSAEARAWLEQNVERLAHHAGELLGTQAPDVLLHLDTRSDNLRVQAGGRLRIFDWPYASLGPAEFDIAFFVQSIWVEGGPRPEQAVEWYAEGYPVRPDALDAAVAASAGFFADRSRQPPLIGLPRVRSIQRRQLKATLAWCATRLDLAEPSWLGSVPD